MEGDLRARSRGGGLPSALRSFMLLHAWWEEVVFLHFLVEPRLLRARLPDFTRLDQPFGEAWLTVVALRVRGPAPLPPRLCRRLPAHAELDLRTCVTVDGEPAFFLLDQAVSSPALAAAARLLGVDQRGVELKVDRPRDGDGDLPPASETIAVRMRGRARQRWSAPPDSPVLVEKAAAPECSLSFEARPTGELIAARHDPLGLALLERYLWVQGRPPRVTRLQHAPWTLRRLEVDSLEHHQLLPDGAKLAAAHAGTPRLVAAGTSRSPFTSVLSPLVEPIPT